jgi:outer membrane receptor for ferrienterochelin and colicin
LTPQLDARAVITWQRGKLFNEELDEYVEYSTDIVAPFRMTAALEWRPMDRLRAGLQATYYGAADYFTAADESVGRVSTDSQFLLDGSAAYRVGPGEMFVAASNLLDDEYINVQNQGFGAGFAYYQAEGRRVTLGYKARF